jgi:hypothetical protein
VDPPLFVNLRIALIQQRSTACKSGIIDDDVKPSEARSCHVDDAFGCIALRNIEHNGNANAPVVRNFGGELI